MASLTFLAPVAVQPLTADPVIYAQRNVGRVEIHVIEVDLRDPDVFISPALAAGGIGRQETFASLVERLRQGEGPALEGQPRLTAAVNGTYFSKRSFRPVGDIVINGRLVHFGGMGTALAFEPGGVDCIRLPKSRHVDWSEHEAALAGGPLLVWDGFAKPMPGGEGFGDPHVFARAAPRTAIGVTRDNHLLLVTTVRGASLGDLAGAMRDLGALYAVNLDGGASTGMWYKGRVVRRPSRPLTNILCVYLKSVSAAPRDLRPPRGLDWRGGHPPRPVMTFAAGNLGLVARLPREWEGAQSVVIEADAPLPAGWVVSVRLDGLPVALAGGLPTEIALDLSTLERRDPKHRVWIGVLDEEGKTVGGVERIFKLGGRG